MSLVAIATPGGLTEISSIALHIASMWPRPITVVEADPDGGRLAVRLHGRVRPALHDLVSSLRPCSRHSSIVTGDTFGPDIRVVAAPASPDEVIEAIQHLRHSIRHLDDLLGTDVLVSVGTVRPNSPSDDLTKSADGRLLVMRCTIEDIAAVVHRRRMLQAVGPWTVLTAGGRLTTVEVARVVHWPVLADLLPADRSNSATLRRRIREFAVELDGGRDRRGVNGAR